MKTKEAFGKGKHVIFGVPGAFTPGCSKVNIYFQTLQKYLNIKKIKAFMVFFIMKNVSEE